TLDPSTNYCLGCIRSAQEIAMWPHADFQERLAIVNRLRERRRAAGRTSANDKRQRRRKHKKATDDL
ncbi:MAG: DUF1289 domain-containing protein, partial [Pseudomonadota bacterium]